MKTIFSKSILSTILVLATSFSAHAQHRAHLAEGTGYVDEVAGIVELYNSQVATEGTPLNQLQKELEEENAPVSIASEIRATDVVMIENHVSSNAHGARYLILIRGGSKYFQDVIRYFDVYTVSLDGETYAVAISKIVKVTVE